MEQEVIKSSTSTKNLTKWKNEPSIEDLRTDYDNALPLHREQVTKINKWLDKLDGKLSKKIAPGRSKVQPKLIRKHAEWRYASLEEPFLSTKDLFDIDPRTEEDVNGAEENQILINYQFNTKIDKVAFINEYIRTCVDEGTVIVQTGWKYQKGTREVLDTVELTYEQAQAILVQKVSKGEISQEEAIRSMQDGSAFVQQVKRVKEVVIANHPTVRVCEYDRIIIDPTCDGDVDKAMFIIIPFETSISELKGDTTYQNLELLYDRDGNLDPALLTDKEYIDKIEAKSFTFNDLARKKFTAYEYYGYWDIHGNNTVVPIKATWVGNVVIKIEELPYPDKKLPFTSVQFMPIRKSVYGDPDGKLIEDNQDILGAITRGMIDIMARSANGQLIMSKGFLDTVNQKRFEDGQHAYSNPNLDPKANIHMQTYPEIPASAMQMINLQNQDAESLTGVMAFNSGISGQALGNTATGVRSALDSASKRELGILRRLSKGIEKIGRKIIAMNAEMLSDQEVIRVTNKSFRTIYRDDLPGEYDLRVNISTAESDNQKIEKLTFMMQTGQQTMDPMEAKLVRSEIYKLQKMPELAAQVLNYNPEPTEQQKMQMQLEMEKLQLENEKLRADIADKYARAGENEVDRELKMNKARVENAKANKLESEKDLLDLNFVQEDNGTKHNRELDKLDYNRQANLDLKSLDIMFNKTQANKNKEK